MEQDKFFIPLTPEQQAYSGCSRCFIEHGRNVRAVVALIDKGIPLTERFARTNYCAHHAEVHSAQMKLARATDFI